ncbi:hypothetical protein TNCV_5069081 [Trichonephila clavipes]|nr:hypothetical protein TNCV_5069081 [Trichonephila clavipes]
MLSARSGLGYALRRPASSLFVTDNRVSRPPSSNGVHQPVKIYSQSSSKNKVCIIRHVQKLSEQYSV